MRTEDLDISVSKLESHYSSGKVEIKYYIQYYPKVKVSISDLHDPRRNFSDAVRDLGHKHKMVDSILAVVEDIQDVASKCNRVDVKFGNKRLDEAEAYGVCEGRIIIQDNDSLHYNRGLDESERNLIFRTLLQMRKK